MCPPSGSGKQQPPKRRDRRNAGGGSEGGLLGYRAQLVRSFVTRSRVLSFLADQRLLCSCNSASQKTFWRGLNHTVSRFCEQGTRKCHGKRTNLAMPHSLSPINQSLVCPEVCRRNMGRVGVWTTLHNLFSTQEFWSGYDLWGFLRSCGSPLPAFAMQGWAVVASA